MNFVENWRKSLEVNVVFEVTGEFSTVPLCSVEAIKVIVMVEMYRMLKETCRSSR